jgi:cytochrome c-type biogenesis protein
MGLHFLGVFKIGFLDRQFQLNVGDTGKMDVVGSFLVGLAFAAGWTPCVGGVLTAVIMTASLESSAYRGLLLAIYLWDRINIAFRFGSFLY